MFLPSTVAVCVRDCTRNMRAICILLCKGQYFHIFGSVNAANVAVSNVRVFYYVTIMLIQGGAKRMHVFQIIVTLFIFNIKNYVNTKTTCNKCSFDYLH